MGGERVSIGQSFKTKTSVVKINILVVDDDSTSLAIVSAMLKTWRHEVTTVKSPVDALSTLRVRNGIDLVVTDLHMPEMNGIELQKQIDEEFKVPVIIMSSDDKESAILESLACGAVYYIVKPIKPDDLKNVWQYAIASRKGKSVIIEEIGSIRGVSSGEKITFENINSASSVNEDNRGKKDCKRKASKNSKDDQLEDDHNTAPKKAKVVWTTSLHNRFLQAIKHVGLEKAVPKRILEFMNVPGLTRENVASHLQKYRIFLKRVADKVGSSKSFTDRTLRSSFASGHPSLIFKNIRQEYPQFTGQLQMRTTFQPGFGGNISAGNASNVGFIRLPNQAASSSRNSVPQLGYGHQSKLLSIQPMIGNTNPLYQANRHAFGTTLSSNNGGISYGHIDGTNSMQMYQQQNQATPGFYNIGASSNYNFGASSNYNFGASGSRGPNNMSNSGYNNSNYAGIRLTNDGELIGAGKLRISGDGLNGGYGIGNDNVTVSPMGNGTFGNYLAQGGSSSAQSESANQCPPAFDIVNQQENPPVLPPLPQRQLGLGNGGVANDFTFDPPQFGESDQSDILFNFTNYQFPHEQQGEDGVLNADFPNNSYNAEVTPTLSQLLNVDLPSSYHNGDDVWNEQSLDQLLQGGEEVVNPDFGSSPFLLDDYFPILDQNPTQQQGTGDLMDTELYNSMFPVDNAPSENQPSNNQGSGDDFIDSLLGNGPY